MTVDEHSTCEVNQAGDGRRQGENNQEKRKVKQGMRCAGSDGRQLFENKMGGEADIQEGRQPTRRGTGDKNQTMNRTNKSTNKRLVELN